MIETLITDLKKQDEYQIFRTFVHKIKEVNENGLRVLLENLSSEKQGYLKTVLQSYRIAAGDGSESVARRVVSVKARKKGTDLLSVATNMGGK